MRTRPRPRISRRTALAGTAALVAGTSVFSGFVTGPASALDPSCISVLLGCSMAGWVNSGSVNIRNGPGTGNAVTAVARRYDSVTVWCYADDSTGAHWDHLSDDTQGVEGWIRDDFVYTGGDITTQVTYCNLHPGPAGP